MFHNNQNSKQSKLQDNVNYPQASIKEYLNIRRETKDRMCLIIFWISTAMMIILMGVGFFYGQYDKVDILVTGASKSPQICSNYIDQSYMNCLNQCSNESIPYIQAVCINSSASIIQSSQLKSQVQIHDSKLSLIIQSWGSFLCLLIIVFLFSLILFFPILIYVYVISLLVLLLGFGFYLLKNVQLRIYQYQLNSQSSLYQNQIQITFFSYCSLAIYFLIFPMFLFGFNKIRLSVTILYGLQLFYKNMLPIIALTLCILVITLGTLLIQILLPIYLYSAGTAQTNSCCFLYQFVGNGLWHPALLTIYYFTVFWFYTTLISWHKHVLTSAVCLWYFSQNYKLFLIERSLKRAWQQLGTSAIDSLLTPIQWVVLMFYSICKQQHDHNCISKIYCKCNRSCTSSAILTNNNYAQSCQISAVVFSLNGHYFFNIGGILTIFLTLFSCMIWVIIIYLLIYNLSFNETFPPAISSMSLPLLKSFLFGLVMGSLLTNLITAPIDGIIFCYLIEKQKGDIYSHNNIKLLLQKCYEDRQQNQSTQMQIYQLEQNY